VQAFDHFGGVPERIRYEYVRGTYSMFCALPRYVAPAAARPLQGG
jgi:hypothetical protein